MDEFKSWYGNENLRTHCHYIYNVLDGEYKTWDINRKLISNDFYVNGVINKESCSCIIL